MPISTNTATTGISVIFPLALSLTEILFTNWSPLTSTGVELRTVFMLGWARTAGSDKNGLRQVAGRGCCNRKTFLVFCDTGCALADFEFKRVAGILAQMLFKLLGHLRAADVRRAYPVLYVLAVGGLPTDGFGDKYSLKLFARRIHPRRHARRPAPDNR